MLTSSFLSRPFVALLLVGALSAFRPAADTRELREVAAFTSVQLSTSVTVIVRQGSPQRVEVEAAAADLPHLATTVVNGQLRISTESGEKNGLKALWQDSRRLGPTTVYVTLPVVRGLAVSSSGRVRAMLSSSGQLGIGQLRADTLEAGVSSSGSLTAAGTCAYSSVGISSSGTLNTAELTVETCQARVSGSGDCQVNVARTLEARISGSGSVLVSGHPQITSRVSGSGRVRLR
jgi:hypothetical protein